MNNNEIESLRAELRDCQIGIEQRNDLLKRIENELKAAQEERDIAKRAAIEYMTWLGQKTRQCLDQQEEIARLREELRRSKGDWRALADLSDKEHAELGRMRKRWKESTNT